MYKIVRKSEGVVRKITDHENAINLISKEITPDISLVVIEGINHYKKEETRYNRIYYVTEGMLILTFDDCTNELSIGDSCFVSKGTAYEMQGTFKAVVINQPAYGTLP